jgi:hypothetical protein
VACKLSKADRFGVFFVNPNLIEIRNYKALATTDVNHGPDGPCFFSRLEIAHLIHSTDVKDTRFLVAPIPARVRSGGKQGLADGADALSMTALCRESGVLAIFESCALE